MKCIEIDIISVKISALLLSCYYAEDVERGGMSLQSDAPQDALPRLLIEPAPKTVVISKPAPVKDDRLIEEGFR